MTTRSGSAPRAVVFDLDGTLIDSRGDIAAACNHALMSAGRAPLDEATIASFVGDGARALLARAFGVSPDAPELALHLAHWTAHYRAHPADRTTLMPGAREAMASLRERGIKVALATNKTRAVTEAIVDALAMRRYFDAIWGGGDGALKPAPDALLAIMSALGTGREETWLVGDAAQDVGCARAAGCTSVAVLGGFHDEAKLRASSPDHVIAQLSELSALVEANARRAH